MIDWRKYPFVRIIIPFVIGILTGIFWQNISPLLSMGCIAMSFITTLFFIKIPIKYSYRWFRGIPLSILLYFIGYLITYYHSELKAPNFFSQYLKNETHTAIGLVTDYSEKENYHRISIEIQQLSTDSVTYINASGNLLVYIKKDSNYISPPQYGDILVFNARIQAIEAPKNPDAFDFQQYWHFQNIHYQCFIEPKNLSILQHNQANAIMCEALKWRNYFISVLKTWLPTENELAVGAALLLGSKDAISDEIRNAYIETGAMHILAISGMHIVLIFGHFEKLLDKYQSGSRRWQSIKSGILISAIILFTLITGLGASIIRAALMSIISIIGKRFKRPVSPFNVLAASAWLLLLYNPYWILDAGFQLSYAAVTGIHLFYDKIQKLLASNNKYLNGAWKSVALGIAAQITVTPIAIYHFHQFTTYFWLTGLIAGFIADWAVIMGVLLLIFNKVPLINWVLGQFLFCLLWLLNNIILSIQKLPYTIIDIFGLTLWGVISIYIIILSFIYALQKRQLKLMFCPLSIVTALCCIYAFKNVTKEEKNELIVYYLPRNTLIDVVADKKCYSFYKNFSEKNTPENKIQLAVSNHRKSLNIKNLFKLNFNEYILNNYFIYRHGYMRLGDYTLLVLDRLPQRVLPLNNCFVVVNGNPKFDIHHLVHLLPIRQIIFDGSNSRKKIEKWKKECQDLGVAYHDVGEKGAWILNF